MRIECELKNLIAKNIRTGENICAYEHVFIKCSAVCGPSCAVRLPTKGTPIHTHHSKFRNV